MIVLELDADPISRRLRRDAEAILAPSLDDHRAKILDHVRRRSHRIPDVIHLPDLTTNQEGEPHG